MDGSCLRPAHDVEGNTLMRVAAQAFHLEIAKPGIDRIAQRGRWLRRTLKAEHALVGPSEQVQLRVKPLKDHR
jgi:hypothetical protein